MKTKNLFALSLALFLCTLLGKPAMAQTPAPHVFHVVTWYSVTGLDSAARAERNAILKEYHEKVTMKNEFILHAWAMGHFFTEDSREFVMVFEYDSWQGVSKANDRDTELERLAWPDVKQREAFMKKFNSYFTHHKDAIYNGMNSLTK